MIYDWTNGVILLRGDSPVPFTPPSHIKEVIPQQQDELIAFVFCIQIYGGWEPILKGRNNGMA